MNKESCDMRRVDRDWLSWDTETRPQIGDFQITPSPQGDHSIVMVLPGDNLCRIQIRTGPKTDGAWHWDGNTEKPTLSPSVDHYLNHRERGKETLWHGYIRAGRMESC